GFFKSWLWQGLKIGAPIGLGFLVPGLGFWAGTALMGASMGGMSLIEKLATKGSLNSEDRVDLAVDFGTGFLGAL
ncbi:MAG: hypothetical protein K2X66_12350, partial [Cyanobacteria bacterium]|nr:hypothetical protein [Cyanobacteriota bacterium]